MITIFRGFGAQLGTAVKATLEALCKVLPDNEVVTPVDSGDTVYPAMNTSTGENVTEFVPAEAFIQIADSVQTRDRWEDVIRVVAQDVATATGLTVGVTICIYGETEAATCEPNGTAKIIGEETETADETE